MKCTFLRNDYILVIFFITLLISCTSRRDSIIPQAELVKKSLEQRIEDRLAQEFEMTVDPSLGYVPKNELIKARKETKKKLDEQIQKTAIPNVQWDERGPNNIGGRTRAIMFDPNDATNKKVWAGGVAGGLWYSNDITLANANWQKVDDFWSNMAVSSMAHDPVTTNTFYVGTGEGFGNFDSMDGDGIWTTTDGGATWAQMANTTSFNDCNSIVCFKADHILVATNNGLRLSDDAGVSWSTVRAGGHSDVEQSVNGDLYASNFSGDVYKSTDDGSTWVDSRIGAGERVEIATAPSDNNYVYALVNAGSNVSNILKSTDAGATWVDVTIPLYLEQGSCTGGANVFTRGQGWYDLIALVSPVDRDKIIVGGVDLHRSEDGGTTWESISYWTGSCDTYLHADQHALISRPGFPNEIVTGNDGGVSHSPNAFTTGSNPTFNIQNDNYNITQFYATAIHPDENVINILAGSQDNGSKRLTIAGVGPGASVTGGDGGFCHIDQDQGNVQMTSYVYNNYFFSSNGTNFPSYNLGNFGRFINPTDYDNDANKLYCTGNDNEYVVIEGVGGTLSNQTVTAAGFGGKVSCIRVTPNVANVVYFGISYGNIWKVEDAAGSPTFTDLGNPSTGYISSIDVEFGNENHLLATYSNYGVTSVVESIDGGLTWIMCEGDLPNMPIRWGIFDPNNADQVLLGTELGVWSTDDLDAASTNWNPTNSGLANTRVDMLEYRRSDFRMVAATHGRGVFTSESFDLDCNIGAVFIGAQVCNPVPDTYTQEVTLTLNNTPASGDLLINGQTFSFPYSTASTMQTYVLLNLPNDGLDVDLDISFSAAAACNKTVVAAFSAPNTGCTYDNYSCNNAFLMGGTGTYTTNGPASGGGCNNCNNALHADWWKFVAPSDGTIDVSSCLKGFDTRFWAYEGSCGSLLQIGGNDDECEMTPGGDAYASLQTGMNVVSGNTYFVEWDNRWSSAGFDFDFTFTPGCPSGNSYLFVDAAAVGAEDGCSWGDAITNLQDAINIAEQSVNVTEIWLKAGIYKPGASGVTPERITTFEIAETISILGGFDGTETAENQRDPVANLTVLSGDIGSVGNSVDNVYHVIDHSGASGLIIDGITISDGNANIPPNLAGAAIVNSGDLVLINCILKDNISVNSGSAILNTDASADLILENVEFLNNTGVSLMNKNGAQVLLNSTTTVHE